VIGIVAVVVVVVVVVVVSGFVAFEFFGAGGATKVDSPPGKQSCTETSGFGGSVGRVDIRGFFVGLSISMISSFAGCACAAAAAAVVVALGFFVCLDDFGGGGGGGFVEGLDMVLLDFVDMEILEECGSWDLLTRGTFVGFVD